MTRGWHAEGLPDEGGGVLEAGVIAMEASMRKLVFALLCVTGVGLAAPAAAAKDTFDVILTSVEGGTVNLQLVGACGGCPLSTMTLTAGIERILKDRVAGVEVVNAA